MIDGRSYYTRSDSLEYLSNVAEKEVNYDPIPDRGTVLGMYPITSPSPSIIAICKPRKDFAGLTLALKPDSIPNMTFFQSSSPTSSFPTEVGEIATALEAADIQSKRSINLHQDELQEVDDPRLNRELLPLLQRPSGVCQDYKSSNDGSCNINGIVPKELALPEDTANGENRGSAY